jgi:hypothetical protein
VPGDLVDIQRPRNTFPEAAVAHQPAAIAPSPDTVHHFLTGSPELSKCLTLVRNTAINLSPKQRHDASVQSAIIAQLSLNTTNRLADQLQRQIGSLRI